MKHAIYLGLILVLLSGCRSQVAEPFPMTLIVTDKLGDKPSDKLPEDIKRLCDVFPGVDKDDTCYYASPVLVRIYGTQVIERSLVTEVSGKFAVKKSNPKFMGRSIRLNIDTMTLGEGFAKATADTAGTASAINACLAKLESPVVFYYIKSYKDSNALAKRIYNTTEALQKAMATELKTNRDAHIVVVVGKHPALKPVDGPIIKMRIHLRIRRRFHQCRRTPRRSSFRTNQRKGANTMRMCQKPEDIMYRKYHAPKSATIPFILARTDSSPSTTMPSGSLRKAISLWVPG